MRGRTNWIASIPVSMFFATGGGLVFLLLILVFIILLTQKAGQGKATLQDASGIFIGLWVVMVPFLGCSLIFSLGIFISLTIENIIAIFYARRRHRAGNKTITFVTLANMFTLPLLWGAAFYVGGYAFIILLVIEVVVWLVEAVLLFILQRSEIDFKEAALFSLVINGPSFLIGLLLPY